MVQRMGLKCNYLHKCSQWSLLSFERTRGMIVQSSCALWRLLWVPAGHSQQDSSLWKRGCSSASHLSPKKSSWKLWKLHWQPCPAALSIFHFPKQEAKNNSQIAVYLTRKALKAGSPPWPLSENPPESRAV